VRLLLKGHRCITIVSLQRHLSYRVQPAGGWLLKWLRWRGGKKRTWRKDKGKGGMEKREGEKRRAKVWKGEGGLDLYISSEAPKFLVTSLMTTVVLLVGRPPTCRRYR